MRGAYGGPERQGAGCAGGERVPHGDGLEGAERPRVRREGVGEGRGAGAGPRVEGGLPLRADDDRHDARPEGRHVGGGDGRATSGTCFTTGGAERGVALAM